MTLDYPVCGQHRIDRSPVTSATPGGIPQGLLEQENMFIQNGICVSYLAFRLREKATAGTILQRCLSQVESFRNRMNRQLCVFKIGLTAAPVTRFQYYKEANYSCMSLLHVTDNLGIAQMLEASLIAFNISERWCRNQRYGGEGPPHTVKEPLHFVYIVGARADQNKPIG